MEYSQTPPDELRELYAKGTVKQRYHVALQRIENPHVGPGQLVNIMSALEGFARSVALHARVRSGASFDAAYAELRNVGPVALLEKHICPAYSTTPKDAFGEAWSQLPEAVSFRNLLVHEATSLHGGTSARLVAAARHIFDKVAAMAGAV